MLTALVQAGVDMFRLNFSHGTHEEHAERCRIIRGIEAKLGRPIGILADMQGPKLRVGTFAQGAVTLKPRDTFRLVLAKEPGDQHHVTLPHPEIFEILKPGVQLLIDDGRVRLEVTAQGSGFADTTVLVGGTVSDHKGVNLPNAELHISPLTAKDRNDLEFALGLGISLIALSFVQKPEDIEEARELIQGRAAVLAKLEKPQAIAHLSRIVELADAIMVARGDLGVEMPAEDVPILQRRIVHACRRMGRPVIVATQMLESMIHAPTPTRAEASDVANAVFEGADAVMTSAETAIGRYPIETISIMDKILARCERDPTYVSTLQSHAAELSLTNTDAVTAAAREMAETVAARAIVAFTRSGNTALRASRERPTVPILALTPSAAVARNLTFCWGITPVVVDELNSFAEMVEVAERRAVAAGLAATGDKLVLVTGFPGTTFVTTAHILQVS
jgi:pyruvate kinase